MPEADVPATRSLPRLREAAAECQACPLHENATQTVFGDGTRNARVFFLGEQPGDIEDRKGKPFVGPAGGLLDRAVAEVGLQRSDLYLTNAVKHFKFQRQAQGKRRIHQKPNAEELGACRPWLRAELDAVRPEVIVVLGATAAAALLGPRFRVTQERGQQHTWAEVSGRSPLMRADATDDTANASLPSDDTIVVATVHPSSVLRSDERERDYSAFVRDLQAVVEVVGAE